MKTKLIVTNVAIMVVFGISGLIFFTEGVRTVQIVGLFASGAVFGASLATLISALKRPVKEQ